MNHSAIAAVVLVVAAAQSCPAATMPRALSAAVEQVCRGGQILGTVAKGDLNFDGVADAAFLLQCDPASGMYELIVLLGNEGDNYEFLTRTTLEQHERRWDEVKIRSGLLIVGQSGADWNRSFKFRHYTGQLKLIGEDSNHYGMDPRRRPTDMVGDVNNYGSSINYLTGTAVHWREAKREKTKVSRTVRFSAGASVPLEGIDFDRSIPGVHGYIDERFVLRLAGRV